MGLLARAYGTSEGILRTTACDSTANGPCTFNGVGALTVSSDGSFTYSLNVDTFPSIEEVFEVPLYKQGTTGVTEVCKMQVVLNIAASNTAPTSLGLSVNLKELTWPIDRFVAEPIFSFAPVDANAPSDQPRAFISSENGGIFVIRNNKMYLRSLTAIQPTPAAADYLVTVRLADEFGGYHRAVLTVRVPPRAASLKVCGEHGVCVLDHNTCTCTTGYTGSECKHCDKDYFGAQCTQCPDCKNGRSVRRRQARRGTVRLPGGLLR